MLRWLASVLDFKLLHTGCPFAHGFSCVVRYLALAKADGVRRYRYVHFLSLEIKYPFDVEFFLLLLQNSGIGYQYLTYILGLGINIGPNFCDWVVKEILSAHAPV